MLKKWISRRCGTIILTLSLLLTVYMIVIPDPGDSIACFDEIVPGVIPDVLDDDTRPPPRGKSIFFHETSCTLAPSRTLSISPRQACAVESAARMNPNLTVYLLYAAPVKEKNGSLFPGRSERIIKELYKYDNIKIRRVDLNRYTKDTPLEFWYQTRELQKSRYPNSHASDVLRYLSLWRYGGTYLDLDVVVMKNLEPLGANYAAAESQQDVAAGVLNFDYKGSGRNVANICIKDLRANFRGDNWGNNGPGVITRALQKVCREKKVKLMTNKKCKGFNVLSPSSFYPISWKNWSLYFDPNKVDLAMNMIKSSYAIHVWNKFSKDTIIYTNHPNVLYSIIAKKYCPNVFRESGEYF